MAHVCAGNSITDQVAMGYQGQTGLKKWKMAVIAVVTVSGAALFIIAAVVLWARCQAKRPAQIVRCKVYKDCRMRCTSEGQLTERTCICAECSEPLFIPALSGRNATCTQHSNAKSPVNAVL